MMNMKSLLLSRVAIVFLMLASYPLALYLPANAGWENGFLESLQLSFLLMGAGVAAFVGYNETRVQWRWFVFMVIPVWCLLIGREVSWGVTFLVAPSFIDPEMGPTYSSAALHGFKFVTRVIAGAMALFCVVVFVVSRQYQSILQLFKGKMLPWVELGLFVGVVICSAADGHGFFKLTSLSAGHLQTFEELFELTVYISVFVAQAVVFYKLKDNAGLFLTSNLKCLAKTIGTRLRPSTQSTINSRALFVRELFLSFSCLESFLAGDEVAGSNNT